MQRTFSSRPALAEYLKTQFPTAAARDPHISPIQGGLKHAEQVLATIEPTRYRASRNYLDGDVTRLSPYLRHGILTLKQVKETAFSKVKDPLQVTKFVTELAWRDYWQRLYSSIGNGVWQDREESKTGWPPSAYAESLPPDLTSGQTGLACIDAFTQELRTTGYLHNHARMWFAAYVVHFRRLSWKAGALFFLSHLLDGDPASNNLSWQWVASTFAHKPYFFNRENLEKYTKGRYCKSCPKRGHCDFEGSYEELSEKLFRIQPL